MPKEKNIQNQHIHYK